MSVYSIKDLEHLSGIKAHTIRIWEQRYNLFSPNRTEANIRFYNEKDLKLILNIATLRDHGYKISRIVDMTDQEIHEIVHDIYRDSELLSDKIHSLTNAMIDIDEFAFFNVLNWNIERYGFKKTITEIVYPFMNKIGILWLTNSINPAQEHFISNLVRQVLIVKTDEIAIHPEQPLFLLFLPERELHELGILYANYLLRENGIRTVFFGQSVPLDSLEEVYHKLEPSHILTAMTTAPDPSDVQRYVNLLGNKFRDSKILITGSRVVGQDIEISANMTILNSFNALDPIIQETKAGFVYDK
ncbi:MAG: MerR family transcriptional regulator [Ekhidna sp.]|nr:MerR family transcriptional regulator [Ekhidna sp.]MBC6426909.1 MerR family transcriptional regulator [Ekhidna sp.]